MNLTLKTIIERGGKKYLVSTVKLPYGLTLTDSRQYETMVFPANDAGEILSGRDLYFDRYETAEAATNGHTQTCRDFQPKE